MRQVVGGTWITQLVIVFMLIFVAFLALSINYTKAFQIKNEMLTMIEKREGISTGSDGTIALINNYLTNSGYRVTGTCKEGSYGVTSLDSTSIEKVSNQGKQYYYCITKVKSPSNKNYGDKVFYKVNIFFYFNLPVIGDIMKFNIDGATIDITKPVDDLDFIYE